MVVVMSTAAAAAAAKDVHSSLADRAWREAHAHLTSDDSSAAAMAPQCTFDVIYAQGQAEAASILQRQLRSLRYAAISSKGYST